MPNQAVALYMARFICLAFLVVFSVSALAGGGNEDKKFRRWRRHLQKTSIVVDESVPNREIARRLSSAIQHHDVELVAKILAGTPDDVLAYILRPIYELPEHEYVSPASALGLAVICGNAAVVNAILNIAGLKPVLADAVFAKDAHGQTPMNMAVYLDAAPVLFEFVVFAALHPFLAPVLEQPNDQGCSPRETALRHGRRGLLTKLNIPLIPSVTALFLAASVLWR